MTSRLLISTKGRLIFWDGKPHVFYDELSPQTCERHPPTGSVLSFPCMWQFFGITWDASFLYVAESGRKDHGHINVFDSQLCYQGHLEMNHKWPFSGIHQIYWWGGKLYIVDTGRDRIAIWDGETTEYVRWVGKDESQLHVNSIWNDGEKFWVVEHRMMKYPKRIRIFGKPGFRCLDTICLERALVAPKTDEQSGLHNVYVKDGTLYTVAPHGLVRYDLASGRGEVLELGRAWGKGNEYLGGLARTSDNWFIGFAPYLKSRVSRWVCDSGIYILNNDFEIEDVVVFPSAGAVTDIRAMDGDLAHNGIRCPCE